MHKYILASNKEWNIKAFQRRRREFPGHWAVVTAHEDLLPMVETLVPRYTAFPHWSYIVPKTVFDATECVCFHMSDVPYGRGGSPLQNLISRGHKETMLSALKMIPEIDAGPVYLKRRLSLEGSAQEIFVRTADLALDMLREIVVNEIKPIPQSGESFNFSRRTPEQSCIPPHIDANSLYDHIRMLDAEGYPHAYIDYGRWRAYFTHAKLIGEVVEANVRLYMREEGEA